MKKFLLHLIFIISAGLLLNTGCDTGGIDVPDHGSLKVAKIEDISSFNGLTDSSWNSIDELAVYVTSFDMMGMMGGGMMGGGPFGDQKKVSIKAQYSDTHIYMLFHWPDKEISMNRMYQSNGENWEQIEGNEDRFNVAWDIGESSSEFYMMGCMSACHYMMTNEPYMATDSSDEKLDLWHWKSQRTDPAGYSDDQFIQSEVDFSAEEITGRKSDDKTGGSYADNWDDETQRPIYAPADGNYVRRGLLKADAVEITDYDIFKEGDLIPKEILERPTGSRGDISAEAEWSDGYWTLMISRSLETGNPDDVSFDTNKTYPFGVSVHDSGDGKEHLLMQYAVYLSFDK